MNIPQQSGKGWVQFVIVVVFIIGSFVISKLLATSYEPPTQNEQPAREIVVKTVAPSVEDYRVTFAVNGEIDARNRVNIVPQVSGRITKVADNFDDGGTFKAKKTLFQIDPKDFSLDMQRLEAEVARARTALELEKAESNAALEEWRQLNGEKRAPDLVARRPQMQQAQAELEAAKAQLDNAALALDRASFSLPFSGRVIETSIAEGQYVLAGQSYGTVYDYDTLEVSASLQDSQLDWLLAGDTAPIISIATSYLGQDYAFDGTLKRSASALESNTRFAQVRFGFASVPSNIVPGLFATVTIQGQMLNDVYVLPASVLQQDAKIWLVSSDNTLTSFAPEIIYQNDTYVVIEKLAENMQIVDGRLAGGADGMVVNIVAQSDNNDG